ncbi:MAG: glycine dehydrogenase, partial [Muribaculaceae bacterium]|nr:glycine dehydrogenase [Muribaculaceae bacterium]
SCNGAHYLFNQLISSGKFEKIYDKPFLKEFVVKTNLDLEKINSKLLKEGFQGGISLGDGKVMFAVTEKRTKEEIDKFVKLMVEE